MFLVIDVYLIVISLFCSPLRIRIVLVKVFVSNISADILSVQIEINLLCTFVSLVIQTPLAVLRV